MTQQEDIEKQTERCLLNAKEFFHLKIEDAMKRRSWDIPLIDKDTEILDVIAILCTNDHIWVVDDLKKRRILGVITEHDLLHALRPIKTHRFFGMPSRKGMGISLFEKAEHIMSHHPFTCTGDQTVIEVLRSMEAHGIRRMPVIDSESNQILSEVTVHQLIKKYYEIVQPLCKLTDSSIKLKNKIKPKKRKLKGEKN
jgi:CBS domain-containing protein